MEVNLVGCRWLIYLGWFPVNFSFLALHCLLRLFSSDYPCSGSKFLVVVLAGLMA